MGYIGRILELRKLFKMYEKLALACAIEGDIRAAEEKISFLDLLSLAATGNPLPEKKILKIRSKYPK